MVPFELELELENKPLTVSAEQLDRLADEEGYIRYDVRTDGRRGVIYVNVEDQVRPVLMTPQDAEALFEAVHYPEQLPVFSIDEDFSPEEVLAIGNAIRQYNRKLRFMFTKFMDRSSFPEL